MKLPYIQFFPKDHIADEKLSRCSHCTRSIWLEFVFAMHLDDRCGLISATRQKLAQIGRCTLIEVDTAITELDESGAADVTDRNGIVTLVNRRMRREWKKRNDSRLRVQKARSNAVSNGHVTHKPPSGDGIGDSPPKEGGLGEGGGDCVCEPSKFAKARIVLHWLNQQAGRKYRETAVNLLVIQARIDEVKGDIEGVKMMIDRQVQRWKGTDQEEYLRPETLFGKQKFGAYYDNRDQPIVRNGSTRPVHREEDLPNYTGIGTAI